MPPLSPATVKLRSQLRLLIPRLRNAQKKDTALSVAARREMADLLASNREQSARIRVENIIHTDITVELMEILELYAELLLARAGMLDLRDKLVKEGMSSNAVVSTDADGEGGATGGGIGGGGMGGLEEAAASLVYSAPRLPREIKELAVVRGLLVERFGKEWAVKVNENEDGAVVPKRVSEKLAMEVPRPSLVQAYLEEIARSYGVDWPIRNDALEGARDEVDGEAGEDDDDDDDDGGAKEQPILAEQGGATAPRTPASKAPGRVDMSGLNNATPPAGNVAKSPISVAPPGARSDNLNPKVKLPGGGEAGPKKAGTPVGGAAKGGAAAGKAGSGGGGGPGGSVPTVDDLAKRFSALKR